MRDSVVIYRSFHDASKNLAPEEYKELWTKLFDYALDDIEPGKMNSPLAEAIITMARPQIDANKKRHNDGCKGGRPKKPPVIETENHRLPNRKPNENENENENVNENVNDNEKIKKPKHKYGEYKNVLLSDEDLEKLKKEFPADYQERIETLSAYMKSKSKRYADHLATIRNWARMDEKRKQEAQTKTARKANDGMMTHDYDIEEIERQLLAQ